MTDPHEEQLGRMTRRSVSPRTMKELVRYTAAADQARLARNAMMRTAKAM